MMEVNSKYKVLFVCLGNICRSPAAHGIFEHIVEREGAQNLIEVDSAGTYGGHRGELPDRRMREAASLRGYSLTHISRQVSGLDLLDFDLVIAMDDQNYQNLMNMAPSVEAARKVKRMSEYLTDNKISYIPDPYYSGMDGFNYVLDLLEEACENLYRSLELNA
jgi:protein-tyrosine phosphatase